MSSSIHQEDLTKSKLNIYYYTGLFTKKTTKKKELRARVDTVEDSQEAKKIIQEYENVITTNKKKTSYFLHTNKVNFFEKSKEDRKFKNFVEQFKINIHC